MSIDTTGQEVIYNYIRYLYGRENELALSPLPHHTIVSVNYATMRCYIFVSLKQRDFQTCKLYLFLSVADGCSLTSLSQKLKNPWKDLFQHY